MKISNGLKWSTLLLVAWFYTGQAQAQSQFQVEPEAKLPVYQHGETNYDTVRVLASRPPEGVVKRYECFVRTGPDVYVDDYTAYKNYVPQASDWKQCVVEHVVDYEQTKAQAATLVGLTVAHGMNFVYFRAIASAGGPDGTPSPHGVANWFVDERADSPKALNVDVQNGEVLAIPGPGGNCHPLVVPVRMETGGEKGGAQLSYSVGGSTTELKNIPFPVNYPFTPQQTWGEWTYTFQHDLVLSHSIIAGDPARQLTVWTSLDRYDFFEDANNVAPWTVSCPPLPPWDLDIVSPTNGQLLTSLSVVSGTAVPGSKIRLSLSSSSGSQSNSIDCGETDMVTGEWTCAVPAKPIFDAANNVWLPLSAGIWTARVVAELELTDERRMATVDFEVIDLIVTVDAPTTNCPADVSKVTGTASSHVSEVKICLNNDCTNYSCTLQGGNFSCDLGNLDNGALETHKIRVHGIGPNNLTSDVVELPFVADGERPVVVVKDFKDGRQLTFDSKPGSGFMCSMDGASFVSCDSPYENALASLPPGEYTLEVYAVDTCNQEGNKTKYTWEILDLPLGSITVNNPENGKTYAGTFHTANGALAQDIDSVAVTLCTAVGLSCKAPIPCVINATALTFACDLGNLNDGRVTDYTLTATGYDNNGAPSAPVKVDFTVDAVLPVVTVKDSNNGRQLDFTSSKPNSKFRCSLDGVTFDWCDSPYVTELANLPEGEYTLYVYAVDALDQAGPTKEYTWTISDGGGGGGGGGGGEGGGEGGGGEEGGTGEPLTREPPYKVAGGSDLGCSSAAGAPLAMLALAFGALARRRRT